MTEQQIQKQILDYLESIGAYTIKVVTANKSGVPDIQACYQGRWISIEVKQPGFLNTLSPLQKFNLDAVVKAGGFSLVATSVEEVSIFLEHNGLIDSRKIEI